MNSSAFLARFSTLLFLLSLIQGCSIKPQYLPKEVEGRPLSDLAELRRDACFLFPTVDGERIRGTPLLLAPGSHTIECEVSVETTAWRAFAAAMRRDNCRPVEKMDAFACSNSLSVVWTPSIVYRPAGIDRYRYEKISVSAVFDAGKAYSLSKTIEAFMKKKGCVPDGNEEKKDTFSCGSEVQ